MKLNELQIDKSWSLFLDRDGVINKRLIDDYVKNTNDFELIEGVAESIAKFNEIFSHIFIVTNQQGIGKGLMSDADLAEIHSFMLKEFQKNGGFIDKIYYCPFRKEENSKYRKPEIGMALHAKKDFPEVSFKKSIMVGDTLNDMKFGKRAGMKTVLISEDQKLIDTNFKLIDFNYNSLSDFYNDLATDSL